MKKTTQKNEEVNNQKNPQQLAGLVFRAGKMNKTITVLVERMVWHKKLRKQYKTSKKYLAHCEQTDIKAGDSVVIEKCRPMSAKKNFRVVSVKAAPVAITIEGETI